MSSPNEKSSLLHFAGNNHKIQNSCTSLNDHSSSTNSTMNDVQVIEANDEPGLPIPRAVFVVTNAALGAGMLAFPEAYEKTGGVPQALAVQAVSCSQVCYCLLCDQT
jgi:hypothetical protein